MENANAEIPVQAYIAAEKSMANRFTPLSVGKRLSSDTLDDYLYLPNPGRWKGKRTYLEIWQRCHRIQAPAHEGNRSQLH